jgi:folate-binding protein YgfZ
MVPLTLHARHASLGATFADLRGREVVRRYALASEDAALRSGAALVDLSAREVVRVGGPDRVSFLHGMVTQDVRGLAEGAVADAALLTAKGAMVSDARVVRRAEDLLLLVEPGFGAPVLEALNRYLISEDVELTEVSPQFGQLALVGPRAAALGRDALRPVGAPDGRLQRFEVAGASGWALPQGLLLPGLDLLVPADALSATVDHLLAAGAVPAGFESLEVLRVERGTPRFGADMDEKTIPLEARLERALNYQKGCYIGQEVIARATFRGHMNRHLVGLSFQSLPPSKSELFRGERRVGWVTSPVESPRFGAIGLGYVHRDVEQPGTALTLTGGTGQATVRALPFTVEDA